MTRPWDPPLPAVPPSHYPDDVAQFLLTQTPEEVLALLEGMAAADEMTGVWMGDFDPLTQAIQQNAREHIDHVVALFILMAKSARCDIRGLAPQLFSAVLCRGFDEVEELAWDDLLQDPNDRVFRSTYASLLEMVADDSDSQSQFFTWTDETYDQIMSRDRWPERLMHYLKLGRTKPRYEAIS